MSAFVLAALPACAAPEAVAQPTAAASRTAATTGQVRHIALQGTVNVRDLGGYRTDKGRQVRYGRVFRADALGGLTGRDLSKLSGLRSRTVVDFRLPEEVRRDGADRLPAGVTAVSRPVDDLGLYARTTEVIGSKDPVAQEAALGDGRAERMMRSIYRTFVTDADSRRQFAAVVRDVAHAKGTPLLYHCTSGKDRTGWTSYVLLRAVGVPAPAAERDFLLSNTFRRKADREVREGLRESGYMRDPDLLVPLQKVREDYLEAALEQAEADYGSLRDYLPEGLGLDTRTLTLLRARLLR